MLFCQYTIIVLAKKRTYDKIVVIQQKQEKHPKILQSIYLLKSYIKSTNTKFWIEKSDKRYSINSVSHNKMDHKIHNKKKIAAKVFALSYLWYFWKKSHQKNFQKSDAIIQVCDCISLNKVVMFHFFYMVVWMCSVCIVVHIIFSSLILKSGARLRLELNTLNEQLEHKLSESTQIQSTLFSSPISAQRNPLILLCYAYTYTTVKWDIWR